MDQVGNDEDGLGFGRAGLFTGTAADAVVLIHNRRKMMFPALWGNGKGGAGLAAGATVLFLYVYHAQGLIQDRGSDLYLLLLF